MAFTDSEIAEVHEAVRRQGDSDNLYKLGLIYSTGWLVWTILLLLMIVFIGPEHPPTLDDHAPLDRSRLIMAVVCIVMLILCFTPAPLGDFPTGN